MHIPIRVFGGLVSIIAVTSSVKADAPAFDRPGIAFSPSTLPAGSFDWEQGLPDLTRTITDTGRFRLYSADTLFRIGMTQQVEFRLAVAAFNRLEVNSAGAREVSQGYGDTGIGIKISLPASSQRLSWAALLDTSLPTGQGAFRNRDAVYRAAIVGGWLLNEAQSIALYGSVARSGTQTSFTMSPNYSVKLSEAVGGFLEGGLTHRTHAPDDKVAGGGLTWAIQASIQLDAYADWGLTRASTDLQTGMGLSVYFK